ncbi:MAG: OmpA family protein [Proteobacteria bacterium]|nr:OmpA family protein [Pseudomonadota bacterium]
MSEPSEDQVSQGDAPITIQRRRSRVHKGEGLWLMSFSDMSLILMSFFVLQLSYSTPNKHKYDNLNSAIKEQKANVDLSAKSVPVENLRTLSDKIRTLIKQKHLEDVAFVTTDIMGLNIEFRDQLIFNPGSSELNPQAKVQVGVVLNAIASAPGDYRLIFEGHTDDLPVGKGKYQSNWELSSARGIALVNTFKARGVNENRMTVHAYAQTKPKVPIKGLSGEALKKARAINRRVVIRLE